MMDVFLPIFLIALLLEVVIIAHLLRKKCPAAPYIALPFALLIIFVTAVVSALVWAIATFFICLFLFTVFGVLWYTDPENAMDIYHEEKKKKWQ